MGQTLGFVGLGRLGVPVASLLLEANHSLVCCRRGNSPELLKLGAKIAGDGSPRAVAAQADVVFTCLPAESLSDAFDGEHGLLAADGPCPIFIELSTAPIAEKARLRDAAIERDGQLLDCPVSGTPTMAANRMAVIYASGDHATYESVAGLLTTVSPAACYVGELGNGTRMKYVANLLALVHVTAAAEAMSLAKTLGLSLEHVVQVICASPAATSGQFQIRGPMIAANDLDGRLVTVQDAREVLLQIAGAAKAAGTPVPLASTSLQLFEEMVERGAGDRDPSAVGELLLNRMQRVEPESETSELLNQVKVRGARMINLRLYVGISRLPPDSSPPPLDVVHDHLIWAQELERRGTLFAAGPFVDQEGAILGDALFVVRASGEEEAAAILATDPIHAGNYRRCTVHGWALHEGQLNVTVNLSDRAISLA